MKIQISKIYLNFKTQMSDTIFENKQCYTYHEIKFKAYPSDVFYFLKGVKRNPHFPESNYDLKDLNIRLISKKDWYCYEYEDEDEIFECELDRLKRYEKERKLWESQYVIIVLYLSGDDDYGALDAKNYGCEKIVSDIINHNFQPYPYGISGECRLKYEVEVDCNVEYKFFVFDNGNDRETALNMIYSCMNFALDYDSGKHTNCHVQELSKDEYVKYMSFEDAY